MMAVDTNVLVRFLVKDDDQQAQLVYQLFKQTEANQECLFVPLLVILETLWVLQSCYGVADDDITKALSQLLLMPILKFEGQPVIQGLITASHNAKCDLADLLIAYSAKMSNCQSIVTFDKKAARFEYFELLTG